MRCYGRAWPWAVKNHILHCHKTFLLLAMLMVAVWMDPACADGPSEADLGIVINEIHCNPDDEMELVEFVELYNCGTTDVSLSGWHFADGLTYTFTPGTVLPAGEYLIVAENPDHIHAKWSPVRLPLDPDRVLGPYEGRLSNEGERIALCNGAGQMVDEVDYEVGFPWPTVGDPVPAETVGTGASIQLVNPSFDNDLPMSWRSALPTPLRDNSAVYTENMHPFVREVGHEPQQPLSDEAVTITARVTDADGVIGVGMEYQIVPAGQYEPGRAATSGDSSGWTQVFMLDDGAGGDAVGGDDVYTAVIPNQPHRTLVRYRFQAMDMLGASVLAPYSDDPSLNFAYFVYDGVPDYEGFSSEMLQRLPVYHLLTRAEEMHEALGYDRSNQIPQFSGAGSNPARFDYKWHGTFVYDGVVYDNIRYRLRGANGRYLGGNTKRSMRFRFNRGHYFQAKDADGRPYPTKWRTLTTAKGFDNRLTLTYALNEHVNFYLYNKIGVPAPYSYYFHFRVIDEEAEAPDPWHGDFWGLGFAQETYDSRFMEAHSLEKGNLYKLINSTRDAKRQQRYQAPQAVMDGSDHDNIENRLSGSSTAEFIRAHVRLDKWYAYHALAQAIKHYDYWPTANKNAAWYFEPVYTPENSYLGLMWTLPWDTDASWGPTWNAGQDAVYDSIFSGGGASRSELRTDYYNAVREVRDLLWQHDQIESLLAEFAAPIAEFIEADRVRWLNAPSDAGNYNGLSGPGKNGLAALIEDMTDFAFEGGSWPGGGVGHDGRAAFLDDLADGSEAAFIPNRPSITYGGDPNFATNALRFQSSAFSDPQGSQTFGALKWRIAEVSPDARVTVPSDPQRFVLVPDGSEWRYFAGMTEPSVEPGAWRELEFDDVKWSVGQTAIGYGENFIVTELSDMRGSYSTIYLRRSFEVTSLDAFDTLALEVKYDDAIIVWINGHLALQGNVASSELPYDATAESALENTEFVDYTLSDLALYLVEGTNVIAVQVINASVSGSSDCFVDVRLTGRAAPAGGETPTDSSAMGNGKYEIETVWESKLAPQFADDIQVPASVVEAGRTYRVRCRMLDDTGRWSHWSGPIQFEAGASLRTGLLTDLRITEVMYNPADAPEQMNLDNDDFEFIELKNADDELLDLSSVSFVDGVTFDFQDGAIVTLEPGQFVLVVRNRDAFELRYGAKIAGRIAGQYEGKLANEGEFVKLIDFWNGTIAEFEYRDEDGWPTLADGAGHSLVPLAAALSGEPTGSLNDGANWRASTEIGGSPGRDDP
jgi:Lamin Tail Domain/CotH kinase protein